MQEEHVGLKGGQQLLGQTLFRLGPVADRGIDGGMTATFGEHEQADLRKRPRPVLIAGAGKGRRVGRSIGHILHRAIQGHQPFAEAEGPDGLWRAQGPTTARQESLQGRDPQLLATVADGRASHPHGAQREAYQVQGPREPLQDAREGQSRPQSGGKSRAA